MQTDSYTYNSTESSNNTQQFTARTSTNNDQRLLKQIEDIRWKHIENNTVRHSTIFFGGLLVTGREQLIIGNIHNGNINSIS